MAQQLNFTSPRQKFLHDLLFEKDRHLYDLCSSLEKRFIENPQLDLGKIIDEARKCADQGKQVMFDDVEINREVAEVVRTEKIIDVLITLLEESGLNKSLLIPLLIGPQLR